MSIRVHLLKNMIIKDKQEQENLIEAGKRFARIMTELRERIVSGVSAEALDDFVEQRIRDGEDTPAFLGYRSEGAPRAYPATLCVSVNDEIVHGIPNESEKILHEGDIVGLDFGLTHHGMIVDGAITVPVGKVSEESKRLIRATEDALAAGIKAAVPGNHIGDISHVIQKEIEKAGFTVIKQLGGHGVGKAVHEEPFIPNAGRAGTGPELIEGMVLALEPIASVGKSAVAFGPDGYTCRTKDGSRSAHTEHTILIEEHKARIITA